MAVAGGLGAEVRRLKGRGRVRRRAASSGDASEERSWKMSQIKNPNTVRGVIHQTFHLLARKHKVSVDKVAAIIEDYHEWMNRNLVRVAVRKVRSKSGHYGKIIRVYCPVDFYWDKAGEFDGCDFDLTECKVTRHQQGLIDDILDEIAKAVEAGNASADTPDIPEAITKHFKDNL
jgi:hypothetical protein